MDKTKKYPSRHIFLSYGHDSYEIIARKIRANLEQKGHVVWTDQELKAGGDWEMKIEQALDNAISKKPNGCFLLLMSEHSVRRPGGYCLNELAKAIKNDLFTIPIKLQVVEPPLSIARVQYLDMTHCILLGNDEAEYERQFSMLINAIEDDALDFDGMQSRLFSLLKPIEFKNEIKKYTNQFVGRLWILNQIQKWITNPNSSKVFWLTGAPGIGKTAISIWLSHSKIPEIRAWHLCQHSDTITSDPKRCVLSLAFYLASQIPEYFQKLSELNIEEFVNIGNINATTLFRRVLIEPLHELPHRKEPVVILIDAIDESEMINGENQLAKFIGTNFESFPAWFKLIITSRPVYEVERWFRNLKPQVLDATDNRNIEDIKIFVTNRLERIIESETKRKIIANHIVSKSEGIFLYAEIICNSIESGEISIENPNEFPYGLHNIYENYFQRRFPNALEYKTQIAPLLQFIIAAKEPIDIDDIDKYFFKINDDWDESSLPLFINQLGSLFQLNNNSITPFHKSVVDWLVSDPRSQFFISKSKGNKQILKWGLFFNENYENMPTYLLKYYVNHCISTNNIDVSLRLLASKDFYTAQNNALGLDYVINLYFENLRTIWSIDKKHLLKDIYMSPFFIYLMSENRRYFLDNGYYLDLKNMGFDIFIQHQLDSNNITIDDTVILYYLYAIENFEGVVNLAQKILANTYLFNSLDFNVKSQIYEVYGLSFRKLGDFKNAYNAFVETISCGKESNNSYQMSLGYANIAKIEYHRLNYKSGYENNIIAFDLLEKSLNEEAIYATGKTTSTRLFLAEYKRLAAECYIWGKEYELAQKSLEYTTGIYESIKMRDRYYIRYLYTSSLLNMCINNIYEAEHLLDQSLKLCRNTYDKATVNYYSALLLCIKGFENKDIIKQKLEVAIQLFDSISSIIELTEVRILSSIALNRSIEIEYDICNYIWYKYVFEYYIELINKNNKNENKSIRKWRMDSDKEKKHLFVYCDRE